MADFGSYHVTVKQELNLEALLHTYGPGLIRFAYSITGSTAAAEDAMEDALALLILKGGKFKSEHQLRGWLYKTTRSRAVDYLRRHANETPLSEVEAMLACCDLEKTIAVRERRRVLYLCMQELPVQYRQVLQLYYFEGFEIEMICRILSKTKKQVYNLLSRAKADLKEKLIREGISHEDI